MDDTTAKRPIRTLSRAELEALAIELGAKPFQARSLVQWVWQRGLLDLDEASDLPKALRQALAERFVGSGLEVVARSSAGDGTSKLLLRLHDGESVEMVLIPEGDRTTLCISSQVGCPVACVFCASGLLGVRRNLAAHEMIEQFVLARRELASGDASDVQPARRLTNLVVMGLGEPMLNLDELLAALDAISSPEPEGFGFSPRRITVSTSGYPERIRRFASCGKAYNLAISLHAAEPQLRKELVPTATSSPEELVDAARDWFATTGREATFEIVLLQGVNDRVEHARSLAALLRGVRCSVNLLPWNRVEGTAMPLATPRDDEVERFRAVLEESGINVTWRRRRGADRDAACGQLRLRELA